MWSSFTVLDTFEDKKRRVWQYERNPSTNPHENAVLVRSRRMKSLERAQSTQHEAPARHEFTFTRCAAVSFKVGTKVAARLQPLMPSLSFGPPWAVSHFPSGVLTCTPRPPKMWCLLREGLRVVLLEAEICDPGLLEAYPRFTAVSLGLKAEPPLHSAQRVRTFRRGDAVIFMDWFHRRALLHSFRWILPKRIPLSRSS